MEHNTRKTLPERSQRDYWELNTKNKKKKYRSASVIICKDTDPDLHPSIHKQKISTIL
jgi:hypothetical protein